MQPDPDILLSQTAGLRQLARCLLHSEQDVEDVLQDAWVSAATKPPRHAGPLQGWLRIVVRNLALKRKRGEGRRSRRVQKLSQAPVETPAELAARSEILAILMREVNRLRPAYRDVIVLRFLDGLSVAAIAQRQGVPEATVHTRLRRARGALRQALEAEWGLRECEGRLAAAAVPSMGIVGQVVVGGAVMGMGGKIAIAGLVVVAGAMLLFGSDLAGPDRQAVVQASLPEPAGAAAEVAAGAASMPAEGRVLLPTAAEQTDAGAAEISTGGAILSGRFLVGGEPAEGIRLEVRPKGEEAVETVSDADGRFQVAGLPAGRKLELEIDEFYEFQAGTAGVEEGDWNGFSGWIPEAQEGLEFPLLLRPTLSGRVLKPDGSPAALAQVGIQAVGLPPRTWTIGQRTFAGADGRFVLPFPIGPGIAKATVGARLESGEKVEQVFRGAEIPADGDLGDLTLGGTWKVRFRVLDPEGEPVAAAEAQTETGRCPATDVDGCGELTAFVGDDWLWVVATGFLPGDLSLEGYRGEELRIQLRRSTELEVRLLLEEGQRPEDFVVEIWGPTLFLARGEPRNLRWSWHTRKGRRRGLRFGDSGGWMRIVPDADGVVLVNGLLPDIPLTLRIHGRLGVAFEQELGSFTIEERKEVTVDLRGRGGTIQGRIVDPAGEGIPGAWVQLWEEGRSFDHIVIGDGEGRFVVQPAFAERIEIQAHADGYLPRTVSAQVVPPPGEDLVLALERGRDVRFSLVDAEGLPLALEDLDFRVIGQDWMSFERDWRAGSYRLADLPVHELLMEVVGAGGRWSFALPPEVERFEYTVAETGTVRLPAVPADPAETHSSWRLTRRGSSDPKLRDWESRTQAYGEAVVRLFPGEYRAELFQSARRTGEKPKQSGTELCFQVVAGESLALSWSEDGNGG